jgi:prepilin-type processing-associated H-X9-DG protein
LRIQSITDGSSTTALFSERLLPPGDMGHVLPASCQVGGPDAKRALFQTTLNVLIDQKDSAAAQSYVTACKSLPVGTYPLNWSVAQWLPSLDYSILSNAYTHVMTPNSLSCTGATDSSTAVCNWWVGGIGAAVAATSNHPGGVNMAFCDGSVKFIRDSIDLSTWWALGTRDGREVISADAY